MALPQPGRRIPVTCSVARPLPSTEVRRTDGNVPQMPAGAAVPARDGVPEMRLARAVRRAFLPGVREMLPPVGQAPATPRCGPRRTRRLRSGGARAGSARTTGRRRSSARPCRNDAAAGCAATLRRSAAAPPSSGTGAPHRRPPSPILRNKLAELDAAPAAAPALLVFLIFAGGGTEPSTSADPRSTADRQARRGRSRRSRRRTSVLEKLRDRITELSKTVDPPPNAPSRPSSCAS